MGAFMQIFSGKFLANTKLNEILFNECLHFLIANKEILKQYFDQTFALSCLHLKSS